MTLICGCKCERHAQAIGDSWQEVNSCVSCCRLCDVGGLRVCKSQKVKKSRALSQRGICGMRKQSQLSPVFEIFALSKFSVSALSVKPAVKGRRQRCCDGTRLLTVGVMVV